MFFHAKTPAEARLLARLTRLQMLIDASRALGARGRAARADEEFSVVLAEHQTIVDGVVERTLEATENLRREQLAELLRDAPDMTPPGWNP